MDLRQTYNALMHRKWGDAHSATADRSSSQIFFYSFKS